VLDTDWIPQVAARGWLIVTRDSMIIQNRNEITAVRENKAKMVALNQRDARARRHPGQQCGDLPHGPHGVHG
jgi:3-methyladenine DNA glycosylase Tag